MKVSSRAACISAAAIAALYGNTILLGADLTWDANGTASPIAQDGDGDWNLSNLNWVNAAGTNVAFTNGDSATFGNGTTDYVSSATPKTITVRNDSITVQNLTLGTATDGSYYNIQDDFGSGALTLAGNLSKISGGGGSTFLLGEGLTLTNAEHVVAIRDTPGQAPEITMNSSLSGSGSLTLNNGTYEQYGTLLLNADSNFTGATTITKGRIAITTSNALGSGSLSGAITIGSQGALEIGGPTGADVTGDININKKIIVTRNTYAGTDFNDYPDAFSTNNLGHQYTTVLSGPIVLDSTDARFRASTSTLRITSNMTQGPNTTAAVFTADGDFAGTISLEGDNTAIKGGIQVINGVEVNFTNQNNIGGPTSPITMLGGTLHPIGGVTTNLNSHVLNVTSWGGGIDVDAGQTFDVNQNLSGNSIGKRGLGTLNIGGANSLTGGTTFFDSGTVNFTNTGTSTYQSLHLRSPVVNIGVGTIQTTNNYSSLGQDSTGTNGGPDKATVNIFGTGALLAGNADFNISDNANTAGTVNLSGSGILSVAGNTFIAKGNGTNANLNISGNSQYINGHQTFIGQNNGSGTVTQTGGSINNTANTNFGFVLGDGRGGTAAVGKYFLSGGSFTSQGEVYAGEGSNTNVPGKGSWIQSGGTAVINNWFVVGRERGVGTVDISGGTLTHTGSGSVSLGDSSAIDGSSDLINIHGTGVLNNTSNNMWVAANGATATMNVADTAQVISTGGEFWVGQSGGSNGTLNISGASSVSVNNWLAVGRNGGNGTINLSGGTLTKSGTGNFLTIGSGGTGTINVSGGVLNSDATYVGEGTNGTLSITGGTVNLNNNAYVRAQAGANGQLLMSGGTLVSNGTLLIAGNAAFSGGVQTLNLVTGNAGIAGAGSLNLSGTASATATSVSTPTVNLSGTSKLAINVNGTNSGLSQIQTLSITSPAKFDLNDNDLIVSTTPKTTIEGYVRTARAGGQWTGSGITTSQALPNGAQLSPKSLAVVAASEFSSLNATNTTFDGVTFAATDTLVKFTYNGDADLNGIVNAADYHQIDSGFQNQHNAGFAFDWFNGDFDYNGVINSQDYALIDAAYQLQSGTLKPAITYLETGVLPTGDISDSLAEVIAHNEQFGQPYANAFVFANVPEPMSLGIISVSALGLLQRRRRSAR